MARALIESDIKFSGSRLDKEKGIVYGCKIIGKKSANGLEYSDRALKAARPLYENIRVNVDHPERNNLSKDRSYRDRFGRFKDVSFQEGKGLYGNFHYNKGHQLASQFEHDVEHDPGNVGFSHNAHGSTVRKGQRVIVESIDTVRSVDLVADPATTTSLFESKGAHMRVRRKNARRRGRPSVKSGNMRRLLESRGEDLSPEKAMVGLIESVIQTEKNPKKVRAKVLQILKVSDSDLDTDLSESRRQKGKTMKSKKQQLTESKLLAENKALKRHNQVRDLCESMGLRPTKVQLKAISAMSSKKEAKKLIESMRSKGNPRKGAKASEGGEGKKKSQDTRAFLESYDLEINDDQD